MDGDSSRMRQYKFSSPAISSSSMSSAPTTSNFPVPSNSLASTSIPSSLGVILEEQLEFLLASQGMRRHDLQPIQLLFISHYRCSMCGLLPVYRMNLSRPKRPRCNRCGYSISLCRTGKYSKLRRKLAWMVWQVTAGLPKCRP